MVKKQDADSGVCMRADTAQVHDFLYDRLFDCFFIVAANFCNAADKIDFFVE
ncbi:hypothetical protein D9M69_643810 [compost metagenome]